MKILLKFLFLILIFGLTSCKNVLEETPGVAEEEVEETGFRITEESFGTVADGEAVEKYIIENEDGLK